MFKYFVLIPLMFLNCSAPVEGNPAILAAINEAIQLKIPINIGGIEKKPLQYDPSNNSGDIIRFEVKANAVLFEIMVGRSTGAEVILPMDQIKLMTFEVHYKYLFDGKYLTIDEIGKLPREQQEKFKDATMRGKLSAWTRTSHKAQLNLFTTTDLKNY